MQEDRNGVKRGGMIAELRKVIWPTGKQTVKSTFVTIAFVLIISVALIILNLIFGKLNSWWIGSLPNSNTVINNIVPSVVSGDDVVDDVITETSGEANTVEELSGEIVSGD